MSRDKQADLKILAQAFFDNLIYDPGCEYGSVGTHCKRPFGNSYVEGDILEMLGIEQDDGEWSTAQHEYARDLYCDDLVPYLKELTAPLFAAGTTHDAK